MGTAPHFIDKETEAVKGSQGLSRRKTKSSVCQPGLYPGHQE